MWQKATLHGLDAVHLMRRTKCINYHFVTEQLRPMSKPIAKLGPYIIIRFGSAHEKLIKVPRLNRALQANFGLMSIDSYCMP